MMLFCLASLENILPVDRVLPKEKKKYSKYVTVVLQLTMQLSVRVAALLTGQLEGSVIVFDHKSCHTTLNLRSWFYPHCHYPVL
jgi:hypothetical protein